MWSWAAMSSRERGRLRKSELASEERWGAVTGTCYFSTHGWRRLLSLDGAALEEEAPFEAARAAARALLLKKVDMMGGIVLDYTSEVVEVVKPMSGGDFERRVITRFCPKF